MNNIAIIGATGLLGKQLAKYKNTVSCPIRFEESSMYQKWFAENTNIDTVWHVARACRKINPRRDYKTFNLEIKAMQDLLSTRARDCKFFYASTKVVYGVTYETSPLPAHTVAEEFISEQLGVVNIPQWKENKEVSLKNLSKNHKIYATTKLRCEQMIQKKCKNFKIVRIWDII
jgi:nucleoside-diphosphate-sugar epimerase